MRKLILFVLVVCVMGAFTASVAQARSVSAQRCVLTPVFLLKSVKDQTISGTWQQRRDLLKFIHKATGENVEIANKKKEFLAEFFAIWHIAPKSLPANYPWPIPVHGVSSDWKYWAAVPRDACGYETLLQKGKNGTVRRFARMKEGFYKVGGASAVDQKSVKKLGGNVITVRSGGLTRADLESSSQAIQDAIEDYAKEVLDALGDNKQVLDSLKTQVGHIGDTLGKTQDIVKKTQKEVGANGRVLQKTHEAVSGNHETVTANSSALQQNQDTLSDIQQTLKQFVDSAKKSDVKVTSGTSYSYWWGFLILGILVLCSVFFRRK